MRFAYLAAAVALAVSSPALALATFTIGFEPGEGFIFVDGGGRENYIDEDGFGFSVSSMASGAFTPLPINIVNGALVIDAGAQLNFGFTSFRGIYRLDEVVLDAPEGGVLRWAPFTTDINSTSGFQAISDPFAGRLAYFGEVRSGTAAVRIDSLTISAIPEPATWTMMIGGFALAGGAVRAQRGNARAYRLSRAR